MTETIFTCQICGRLIKAKNGIIAHHGYQRPGDGYQTRSCFGARHVPYEVGHNALDEYKKLIEEVYLPNAIERRAKFIAEPPMTLKATIGKYGYNRGREVEYQRPETFNAEYHAAQGSHRMNCYEGRFTSLCWEFKHQIQGWRGDLEFITKRRAAWKASA